MALGRNEKDAIISEYHVHDKDTGSPEVQIALLSNRMSIRAWGSSSWLASGEGI